MKMRLVNQEIVQQIVYALLGLAFIAMLLASAQVRSETTVIGADSNVVITGEISSIEGNGFALKHGNGITLISLEDINKKDKNMLADSNLIKIGNTVTVTGDMGKGDFNKPVLKASNIVVTDTETPIGTTRVIPVPVKPGVTVVPATP